MRKYILILNLIAFIACETVYDDEEKCSGADGKNNKNNCWNVELKNSGDYCCYREEEKSCLLIDELIYDIYSNPKSYAIYKEGIGFRCYNLLAGANKEECEDNAKEDNENIVHCKNGKITCSSELYSFEESEK